MISAHRLSILAAAALLAGCASVSPDGLRGDVSAETGMRAAYQQWKKYMTAENRGQK